MAKPATLGSLKTSLDPVDWIILEAIQRDARISYAELERKASLSPPSAAERLRRLEDAGVIGGFHAVVRPEGLGLEMTVFIDLHVKRADFPKVHTAVQILPWVLECHHVSGRASFLIKAAVPNVASLDVLIGHLSQFEETGTSLALSPVVEKRVFQRGDGPGSLRQARTET
ncbi:MAG: Lrp/AsnC family transcriptional regulator [Acidobacteria bacterium]|nr:Lrp/AsnC family transcriptional regulator [Acidobacteriota bacterium]